MTFSKGEIRMKNLVQDRSKTRSIRLQSHDSIVQQMQADRDYLKRIKKWQQENA